MFPLSVISDVPREDGKLKFTAMEGRCLINAFQVQTNLQSLTQRKQRKDASDKIQPLRKAHKGV